MLKSAIARYGAPSLYSAIVSNYDNHNKFYTEQDANARSLQYFAKLYGGNQALKIWNFDENRISGFDSKKDYWDLSNQKALTNAILFKTRIETKPTTDTGLPDISIDETTFTFIF